MIRVAKNDVAEHFSILHKMLKLLCYV